MFRLLSRFSAGAGPPVSQAIGPPGVACGECVRGRRDDGVRFVPHRQVCEGVGQILASGDCQWGLPVEMPSCSPSTINTGACRLVRFPPMIRFLGLIFGSFIQDGFVRFVQSDTGWLTRPLFLATGARHPDRVEIMVFEVG
jgi:hypothetical protein